ncbi:hypothetical protein COCON_G00019960 [Conger conger]|uniref:Uncharacterized protein n=1 Tax=Conger conger TaxID=82655 RepID=A0A9Q1DWM3_CONCO|nr:hypothetical protein COCON_G00019960 [Conger conger]
MGSHSPLPTSRERHAHPHLCPEAPRLHTEEGPQFIDPLTGVMVRSYARHQELEKSLPPAPRVGSVQGGVVLRGQAWAPHPGAPGEPASDSGVDPGSSSISLVELCDCSDDDDITDITSGVFGDVPAGGSDSGERGTPNLSPVQKQAGTPDSIDDVTPPPVTELQLCENRPYRDSAYFSDCEAEGGGTTLGVEPVAITPPEELCSLETASELPSQSQEEESPAERPGPSASAQRTMGAELLHEGPASEWNRDAMRLDEKKQEAEERGEEKEMQVVKDMKEEEGLPGAGEEGDSEDSEGSDEEVRSHSAAESEEEDPEECEEEDPEECEEEDPEECKVVPLVVSDGRHACHLRSVLRSLSPTQERKAKTVSFFSDVTVYLFDQESPTQELAEPGLPVGAEPGPEGPAAPPNQERVSDDSSDGNLSEESGGLEWEDDFPLLPRPSLMMSSPEVPPARFSGFSVSRFSLTHVSDSDMDSAGGSSEDGERE